MTVSLTMIGYFDTTIENKHRVTLARIHVIKQQKAGNLIGLQSAKELLLIKIDNTNVKALSSENMEDQSFKRGQSKTLGNPIGPPIWLPIWPPHQITLYQEPVFFCIIFEPLMVLSPNFVTFLVFLLVNW